MGVTFSRRWPTASQAHLSPGFVLGCVLESEIRFGVDGGEQTIYRATQVFYEPPGVLHSVSANASPVNPARVLAIVVAEKGAPITVTPGRNSDGRWPPSEWRWA